MPPSGARRKLPRMTAEEVAAWLVDNHIGTKDLAQRIGVTQRCVDIWKSGLREPPWYVGAVLHYLVCPDAGTNEQAGV